MSFGSLIRVRHTLAFRLTLWYAAIFTVTSALAFVFFYMLITSVIRDRTDQDLLEKVGKFSTLLSAGGMDAVKRLAVIEAQAAGERKIFFRALSLRGEVFSSSNMSYWRDIGIGRSSIEKLLREGRHVFDTVSIPERSHKVRILYAFLGQGAILQLGQSMETYTRFIEVFEKIFITTMVLLVVLAALIGWFMARKALFGLGSVTRTAQRISMGALEDRVPVNNRGDEIDRLAVTFNQMLDRIQRLVMEIKEMSDNMAHDLKSPITGIRGIAEVTLTTDTSLDDYQSMAANTIEECDRLLDMINTMLLISKTEAGVGQLTIQEIDMAQLVQEACALFSPLADEKGLTIGCHITDPIRLRGDIRMIQRMMANFLDNAIKYTPSNGRVDISLLVGDDDSVVVSISDTGVGISEKDLPHIFKRFYRGDPSRPQTGSGLGLSLAQAVVKAHGGKITVISNSEKGSTFSVVLPGSFTIQ